jgi:hypothetical protein
MPCPARDPKTNPALFGLIGRIAVLIGALSRGPVIAADIFSPPKGLTLVCGSSADEKPKTPAKL